MSTFIYSTGQSLLLSPLLGRTRTPTPFSGRTYLGNFSFQKPLLRGGNFGIARFGLGQVPFPDPEDAEIVIKDMFGRVEGFLHTIADAAVSTSDAISTSTTKQNSDWLSGITNAMEVVLKVLKDGLSTLHVPYAYGFAIILLTILVKAATYPLTKKQVESAMAMQSLAPQIKAIQERYAGDQERVQLETARLYKLAGINPPAVMWGPFQQSVVEDDFRPLPDHEADGGDGVYTKECVHMYSSFCKDLLEESFSRVGVQELSIDNAQDAVDSAGRQNRAMDQGHVCRVQDSISERTQPLQARLSWFILCC